MKWRKSERPRNGCSVLTWGGRKHNREQERSRETETSRENEPKRTYPLAKAKLDAGTNGQTTAPAQPEAPVETPQGIPPQFIVEIQGRPFVQFAGLLALAHARGLASLTADFLTVTADLALAHAV